MLDEHRRRQQAEYDYLNLSAPEHDLVFTSELATPVEPKNLFRVLRTQAAKAGLPPLTLHAFRHLHASFLIAQGVDIRSISDRLGHASAGFTLQRYSKEVREYNNRTALTVEEILRGRGTTEHSTAASESGSNQQDSGPSRPLNDQ